MTERALFPPPKTVQTGGDALALPGSRHWRVAGEPGERVWGRLEWALGGSYQLVEEKAQLRLEKRADLPAQAYSLDIDSLGVRIAASGDDGFAFGLATLRQWLRRHRRLESELPGLHITDAPDFEIRGVMLDVSRNKVPTLSTLEELIDDLASFKINHLQLYTEHTFAYVGHENVWRDWSPYSARDMRRLDAFCHERFVELAPNQNSFGHMHRWLVHPEYVHLAECPEGIEHPFGFDREPFSLCPTEPRSLELLEGLYDQLLPCFGSRRFNVGLDETFDLGEGRSRQECTARGKGPVYLDFLRSVHRRVRDRGHTMLFWGDIILESPELIPLLPEDVVALEWGYEADHPFEEHGRHFAESGREFWVCPGTSSWNSIGGRTSNARLNLAAAAAAGSSHGARGYLITDWGDFGHLQPLPVSLPGFVAGAGHSWSCSAGAFQASEVAAAIDAQWSCAGLGDLLADLGEVHTHSGATPRNNTALFQLFNLPERDLDHPAWSGLHASGLERCVAELHQLGERAAAISDPLMAAELTWAANLLQLASNIGLARVTNRCTTADLPATRRADFRQQLGELDERLASVWLARNRPGGMRQSRQRLSALYRHLEGAA